MSNLSLLFKQAAAKFNHNREIRKFANSYAKTINIKLSNNDINSIMNMTNRYTSLKNKKLIVMRMILNKKRPRMSNQKPRKKTVSSKSKQKSWISRSLNRS